MEAKWNTLIATSQHRNIATSQHRNIVITIFASTAISFSPAIFAFSFSNWFSSNQSNKPTQVAQADLTNPAGETRFIASKNQNENKNIITHHPKHKHKNHHKKYHHTHPSEARVQRSFTRAPIIATPAPLPIPPRNNEITLSGGLTISSLSNGNQSVVIDSDPIFGTTNTYNTQKSTQVSGMGGIAYSRLFHFKHDMSVTIGPALYYTNMDEVSGIEHPSTNYAPDYDTLNYHYSADSVSLMAESRAIYEKYNWQPFATVGIGPSWNRLYDYSEVPTDPNGSALAAPAVFRNNTSAQFAYEAGVGIQRLFPANEKHRIAYRLALSYRYFNFGSGELKAASTQTTNQALKVNTLDTQAVLLSLGAVF